MMDDVDFRAENEFTRYERRDLDRQRKREDRIKIGIEAERVIEELGIGDKEPTFANGTRAFVVELRESVAKDLYEELDGRYGEDSDPQA